MRKCWLLLAILLCGIARAQDLPGCDPAIEDALRAFDAKTPIEGNVVAAHCKPWPPSAGAVLAAVMAFRVAQADERRQDWDVPAVVALVDARTHKVLHGRRLTVGEDTTTRVGADSLVLDTANFVLAPGVRALGLRFRNDGRRPSAADGWWGNELMLLVTHGRRLEPVFCLPMHAQIAMEGSLSKQSKGAIWRDAKMTVAIGPPTTTYWNDLVITATVALDGAEDAKFDPAPQRSQHTYRNDGKAYKLLGKPAPFWAEYGCSFR